MTITNLTVTDKGEIVEASFQLEECNVLVQISNTQLEDFIRSERDSYKLLWAPNYPERLNQVVHSYLNQNLK